MRKTLFSFTLLILLAPAVLAGGANGPDAIPTITFADFQPQMWLPGSGGYNWPLFTEAMNGPIGVDPGGGGLNGLCVGLVNSGQAPAFYEQSWSGWSGMDETDWGILCNWIAAACSGGDDPTPWPLSW